MSRHFTVPMIAVACSFGMSGLAELPSSAHSVLQAAVSPLVSVGAAITIPQENTRGENARIPSRGLKLLSIGYSSARPTSPWNQRSETAPASSGTGYIWFTVINFSARSETVSVTLTLKDPNGERSRSMDSAQQPGRTMYVYYFPVNWSQAGNVPAGIYDGTIRVAGGGSQLKSRICLDCK